MGRGFAPLRHPDRLVSLKGEEEFIYIREAKPLFDSSFSSYPVF